MVVIGILNVFIKSGKFCLIFFKIFFFNLFLIIIVSIIVLVFCSSKYNIFEYVKDWLIFFLFFCVYDF